jgi:N-acetyltransferase
MRRTSGEAGRTAFDPQPILEGERLILRPLREEDRDALGAAASDPLIWAQHPVPDRWRPNVFRAFFDDALGSGTAFAAVDRGDDRVIGTSRFHGHDPAASEVEIGWTFLARSCWGGAWNGEMKRLMLAHAFRFVDNVVFLVGPDNFRSRRAIEKIGGLLVGTRVRDGRESVVYRIRALDWMV